MDLSTVRFLPMQPRSKYPAVLHASDVFLTTLRAKVTTQAVPFKILSVIVAGRPAAAAMGLHGDAPRLNAEARCGMCVHPEDPQALDEAVLHLYDDAPLREEFGLNGRRYAEQHLSLNTCVEHYETLLRQLLQRRPRNGKRRSPDAGLSESV